MSIKTDNHYEAKLQARKDRYTDLANAARQTADERAKTGSDLAKAIPLAQPILVGHHSEKKDRAYRAKIGAHFDAALEAEKKAAYYEKKAAAVGKGGISSDDPEALVKLKKQVAKLEEAQELMKNINKIIRKHKDKEAQIAEILALNLFSAEQAKELVQPDFAGRVGFAPYQLTNNNANIRRIKKRIEQMEKLKDTSKIEVTGSGFICQQCPEENRVSFIFDDKPSEEVRAILKSHAFKWSPTRGAWVRKLSPASIYAAKVILKLLS